MKILIQENVFDNISEWQPVCLGLNVLNSMYNFMYCTLGLQSCNLISLWINPINHIYHSDTIYDAVSPNPITRWHSVPSQTLSMNNDNIVSTCTHISLLPTPLLHVHYMIISYQLMHCGNLPWWMETIFVMPMNKCVGFMKRWRKVSIHRNNSVTADNDNFILKSYLLSSLVIIKFFEILYYQLN